MSNTPVIGLTGGVGSGKSTVARAFADLGCEVIDADKLGHALLGEADVRQEIREQWGQGVFSSDGQVDRKALGSRVFSNPEEMHRLEAILHPRMRAAMEDRIAALRGADGVRAIVIDAAVLFEAGWNTLCDTTVFVEAPEPVRLDRVRRSRGWSEADFHQREAEQFPLDRKRRLCCYSVQNVSDVSHLPGQVTRVLDEILA